MSRIHEALKKAAQERSSQLAASGEPSFLEVADAPRMSVPLRELEEQAPRTPDLLEAPGFLRYEDLIKRCNPARWRIDARTSVFEGADEANVGAERFRTLRSRLYQISGTRPLRRMVVTSSVPAEGKTFVAANPAPFVVRQPGRDALRIDAEL